MFRKLLSYVVIFLLLASCVLPASSEEGLWTFDHFPVRKVSSLYRVNISKDWLDHVMRSAVRLSNGCSASLITNAGLVMTNNHCVAECVEDIESAGHGSFNDGFVADNPMDEIRCGKLSAQVLLSVSDVTSQIEHAGAGLTAVEAREARQNIESEIERLACSDDATTECQVSEFYSGAQYKLFKYHRFDDIRLTFSPGVTMSNFDNDQDPLRRLDIAFLRVYEKNRPAVTLNHLHWNDSAPRSGELVFVAGNPRISERALTAGQLNTERDLTLPLEIMQRRELNARLSHFAEESGENRTASEYALADSVNHTYYIKLLEKAVGDEAFMTQKLSSEAALRAQDPSIGVQFSIIAKAEQFRRQQALARQLLVSGPFFDATSSKLFAYARILVRCVLEMSKASSERLPGYSDSELHEKERRLFTADSVYVPLERLILEFWLDEAKRSLSPQGTNLKVLMDGQAPRDLAANLSRSKLGDQALRKELWEGGLKSIQASDDPMIQYVLRLDPLARDLQFQWEETVTGPESQASAAIAKARLRISPDTVYPDANGTLRLSYGKIEGLMEDGRTVGPFTTLKDLFHKAAGQDAPKIDQRWIEAENRLNLKTVLNIYTTNDGINGNSGSPLINARGEAIGAFFGGTEAALAGDYVFDPGKNRAVAVSAAAINEVLIKVYAAPNIAKELGESGGRTRKVPGSVRSRARQVTSSDTTIY